MKKKRQTYCQIEHVELRRLLSTIFVSSAATAGGNNGTSWTDAYTDLQIALSHANSGDVVAVAQGTYKPTSSTDRTAAFHLVSGVTIEGGFAGSGSPGARDPALYPTILSGDIGASGGSDNSIHVVYARSVDNTAVLDGFTITAGNANVGPGTTTQGGGVFDLLASPTINDCTISGNASTGSGGGVVNLYSSATLTNCTISGNTSGARGGGIYDYQSSPSLTDCTLSANTAHEGGGISNKKSSDAVLSNCTISGNSAATGGGIANYKSSSPELTDCILTGNTATEEGGGVWNDLNSSPTLINCVISGNASIFGGGGVFSESTSNPTLTNCTFNGNTARYGGAIYNNSDASATLTNSILWGDTASISDNEIGSGAAGTNTTNISFSDVEGGSIGVNNNIVADPKFIRAVGAGGPGDFGNLRLQSSSPAIGAGNASASGLSGITTDLDGVSRTVSSHVDMGAYEAHYAFQSTVFVDASATGANTGSTWANAYSNLAVALDYAVSGETINVAQGTYYASTDASRFDTFQLIDGVILQGGFAGQADPSAARDASTYTTTLSGDIGTPGVIGDNTYNVVTGSGTDNTAVLDGFTITAGYASGNHPTGGGIIDFSGSPTITDSIITGNTSTGAGGGMFNYQSSPVLNNCTISGNTGSSGAGMVNENNSSPALTDCTISGNMANQGGGGIYNSYSSPTLVGCIISGNSAATSGGGINDDHASPTLINCVLSGNSAVQTGGALSNTYADSLPTLTNCTLSGNSAGTAGGALYDLSRAKPTLTNCILWADTAPNENEVDNVALGTATITFSDIDQSGFAGSNNNVDVDPQFVDPTHHNYRIKVVSPVANAGLNSAIAGTSTDLDGNPRIINSTVDLGAYETRPIIYVDASATGTNDGTSFANAYTTLTAGLAHATFNSGETIYVAQGTYKPTTGTDRNASFGLIDGVDIDGGFAGDTTANPGQRDVSLFTTILSGDIGNAGDNSDNSYHVVYTNGLNSTASLDGFTITAGNASNSSHYQNDGGGITILNSSPTISDCIISGNTALNDGGGIYTSNASPILSDCTVSGNTSGSYGGGIYNQDQSSPILTNCIISGNSSHGSGGGIYNQHQSSPILTNCIISGNSSSFSGGGIYNNAGSSPTLTNCIISGNSAAVDGGGINNWKSSPTLVNCTISGNTASSNGGGICNVYDSATTIINSIIWDDTGGNEIDNVNGANVTITYSDINPADIVGTANLDGTDINADPQFIRNVGTLGPDDSGDFHLNSTSPAINAGSNAAIAGTSTDLDGNARIFGGTVDMGAFEDFPTALVIFTQPGATVTAGEDIPVRVAVEDPFGGVIGGNNSNVTISFVSSPAGAALGGTSTLSDQSGLVTFNDFFLTTPGSYTLLFSDGSLATATSNTFTVTPGAPASLTITQQPTNTTAGQTISSIQVQAKDQYGNLADGSSINVALATSPSGATLTGTTPVATSGGTATFSNLSLTTAGTYTLSISDGALPGVTSSSFTISPSAPATLIFSQQPVDSIAGQNIPVQVEVEDQYGNLADGTSVTLSVASGPSGATFSGTHTEATTNGIATFNNLTLDRAGAFTLSASDGNLTALTSQSFTITYAGPQLVFVTEPASIVAGAKIPAFRVSPEDINGNPLLTNKSKITIRSSAGKLLGTSTAAIKNGVAIFKNLSFQQTGSYTFQVTDSGFGSALSDTITVSAATAAKMVFNPQPSSVAHGTPFNVTVELTDKFGNAVDDGSTVNLVLGSHPKTATSLNLDTSVSDGVADFDGITLGAAGNYTFKASDGKSKATSKKFVVN